MKGYPFGSWDVQQQGDTGVLTRAVEDSGDRNPGSYVNITGAHVALASSLGNGQGRE